MNVNGTIVIRRRVRYRNRECYGITTAKGTQFQIRIAESVYYRPLLFAETLLHELMHLWLFILSGRDKQYLISQRKHHNLIDKTVPLAVSILTNLVWRKK